MDFPMSGGFFSAENSTVLVTLAATLVCILVVSVSVCLKGNSQANPDSAEEMPDRASNGINRGNGSERRVGASMLEQLVPDVMDYVFSYLDFQSLCSLSMTNSNLKKATDDEDLWKSLYYKDFAPGEGYIAPLNGWKAYYATTRAVLLANTEFYRITKARLFPAMKQVWLRADYVKCVHEGGFESVGYASVLHSWRVLFCCMRLPDFEVRQVRAHIVGGTAWVTMKVLFNLPVAPFHVTNVFELHDGKWLMVLHHCLRMQHYQGYGW